MSTKKIDSPRSPNWHTGRSRRVFVRTVYNQKLQAEAAGKFTVSDVATEPIG